MKQMISWFIIAIYLVQKTDGQVYCASGNTDPNCICTQGFFKARIFSVYDCRLCSVGTYNGNSALTAVSTDCTPCQEGNYASSQGTSECSRCTAGYYQPYTGRTGCYACLAGTYQPYSQSTFCYTCTSRTYAKQSAAATCTICEPGKYQTGNSASSCNDCSPGFYQQDQGQTFCSPCSSGTYQDQTGQSVCKSCTVPVVTAGNRITPCTYTANAYLKTCPSCNAGKQISPLCTANNQITSEPVCVNCAAGSYQPNNNQANAQCQTCPQGTYQDLTAQLGCKNCNQYANTDWANPYRFNATSNECPMVCKAGYFPSSTVSNCVQCPQGKYRQFTNLTACLSCNYPANSTATNAVGLTTPQCPFTCNLGYLASGTSACTACAAGTYRNLASTTACATLQNLQYHPI